MKNAAFLILYLVSLLFYHVRLTLYRLYLFAIFALRLGGAIVITTVLSGGFYLLRGIEAAPLPAAVTEELARWRDWMLSADILVGIYMPGAAYSYEIVCAIIATFAFLGLRVLARFAGPVFYAFPMPRRPLPPVRRWEPPKYRIKPVACAIVTPKRERRLWSGDWSEVAPRLKPELRTLLEGPQEPLGLPVEGKVEVLPPVAPAAPVKAPSAPVEAKPSPASVSRTPRKRRAPSGPPLPPRATA